MPTPYKQNEAFCLMKYANKDGTIVEWLWNSRDGITPFCIMAKDAPDLPPHTDRAQSEEWRAKYELRHTQWGYDRRMPNYQPLAGERVFVTLTLERAIAHRTKYVEKFWDVDMGGGMFLRDSYACKGDAILNLVTHDVDTFGSESPDIITGAEYLELQKATAQ